MFFNNKKAFLSTKAFTLIELIIVIVILGVLAALISGNFITSLKKGRDARRKGDLEQIQRALEMRYEDKKNYPDFALSYGNKLCETQSAATCGTEKVYMQKIPNDPINGRNYEYQYDDTAKGYRLYACLENNLQILPYSSLTGTQTISCSTTCSNNETPPVSKPCFWGISSSNVSP